MSTGYSIAKERYARYGVYTDEVIKRLDQIKISLHCWQGDDVKGFLFNNALSGGIAVTGNYIGKATNPDELRADLDKAFSLIAGRHKLNLHAIYADTDKTVDLDELEPQHFATWVEYANQRGIGLDFNPTCFSHRNASDGFTVSHHDEGIRSFWVEHCKRSRTIGEYFGKQTGQRCVTNFWFPDGYKDMPIDRLSPRLRMERSLNEIFSHTIDERYNLDAIESKVFGIGTESYVVGSNEFCLGYATKHNKAVCLDAGHFHPTEVISDKIPTVLMFTKELLLHVSRPVRWDSDHVVIMDDELMQIAHSLVRGDLLGRTHIGLDFFDGSINRVAAWVIGTRNMQKALLKALLEPTKTLAELELLGDYTARLAMVEELKSEPFVYVWEEFLDRNDTPIDWLSQVKQYEIDVLAKRG